MMDKQIEKLFAGTEQVLPAEDLAKKLSKKKRLKIKFGVDPTAPDIHLGHAVVLSKLKQFQDLGHEVIFLIGDFTTKIGDPTGKSKTRPPLSDEEIESNAQTYLDQVGRILATSKTTIRRNSEWLAGMDLGKTIGLCSKVTLARLIEREDFKNRLDQKLPISTHEILYPLLQGYDSVALESDVELGGTDQTFNLLMGRHLQEQYGQIPQIVMTMPIIEGLDGKEKMSKSLNNHVALTDSPEDAFGKLMSIPDETIFTYLRVLLHRTSEELDILRKEIVDGKLNPMDLKKQMAFEILERFWSKDDASKGQHHFESIFQKKDFAEAKEIDVSFISEKIWIVELLKKIDAVKTSSEAKRLLGDGAVSIDDKILKDFSEEVEVKDGQILKVGRKRFFKLKK